MGKRLRRKMRNMKKELKKVKREQSDMKSIVYPDPVSPELFQVGTKWTTTEAVSYEMIHTGQAGVQLIKPVRNDITLEIKDIDKLQEGVMMARLEMYAESGDYEDNGLLHLDLRSMKAKIIETGPFLTKHSQSEIYTQGMLSVGDLDIHSNGNLEGLFYTDISVRSMPGLKLSHELLVMHQS